MLRQRGVMAAATSTGLSLVTAGVAFLVNIAMARTLGPENRGHIAFVLQAAYVLTPVVALGVDRMALRGVDSSGSRPRQGHIWLISGACALAALPTGSMAVLACVATAATGASLAIERGRGMAASNLRPFVMLALAVQGWILVTSAVLFFGDVADVNWWYGVYVLPAPLLGCALLVRHVREGAARSPRLGVGRKSLAYMLGGIGALLAGRIERLLLPVLSSSAQLGLYMSVATASELIAWAARGLGESRVSTWVDTDVRRRQLARIALRDLAIFGAAAVPLGVLIAVVVVPLLGPAFADADTLIIPLCVTSVLWSVYLQLSSRWLGAASVTRSLALDLTTSALTTVWVLLLVPDHGALGAAWACAISYGVMIVVAVVLAPQPRAIGDSPMRPTP